MSGDFYGQPFDVPEVNPVTRRTIVYPCLDLDPLRFTHGNAFGKDNETDIFGNDAKRDYFGIVKKDFMGRPVMKDDVERDSHGNAIETDILYGKKYVTDRFGSKEEVETDIFGKVKYDLLGHPVLKNVETDISGDIQRDSIGRPVMKNSYSDAIMPGRYSSRTSSKTESKNMRELEAKIEKENDRLDKLYRTRDKLEYEVKDITKILYNIKANIEIENDYLDNLHKIGDDTEAEIEKRTKFWTKLEHTIDTRIKFGDELEAMIRTETKTKNELEANIKNKARYLEDLNETGIKLEHTIENETDYLDDLHKIGNEFEAKLNDLKSRHNHANSGSKQSRDEKPMPDDYSSSKDDYMSEFRKADVEPDDPPSPMLQKKELSKNRNAEEKSKRKYHDSIFGKIAPVFEHPKGFFENLANLCLCYYE